MAILTFSALLDGGGTMWKHFCLVLVLMVPAAAAAQSYSGTYSVQNQQGELITLTVTQDAQGILSGSMSGNNQQYQLEGMVEEGIAVGAIYNGQGGVYFEAQLQGAELLLTLIEPGESVPYEITELFLEGPDRHYAKALCP